MYIVSGKRSIENFYKICIKVGKVYLGEIGRGKVASSLFMFI